MAVPGGRYRPCAVRVLFSRFQQFLVNATTAHPVPFLGICNNFSSLVAFGEVPKAQSLCVLQELWALRSLFPGSHLLPIVFPELWETGEFGIPAPAGLPEPPEPRVPWRFHAWWCQMLPAALLMSG